MAEETPQPTPTYKVEHHGERTVYTCIIADMSSPDGVCGHRTFQEEMMVLHQGQRHAGQMIPVPEETSSAEGVETEPPAEPATQEE